LGFLNNPYVPGGVCDDVAKVKVQAIDPGAVYLSERYSQVLRAQVISIVKQAPILFIFTEAAKLGVALIVIVFFSNAGLLAALFYPKAWGVELAFWAAMAASILPILLDAPAPQYLVGLCSLATLYGVFSIHHALQSRCDGRSGTAEQLRHLESEEEKLSRV
jgi:hypothetical protein